MLGIGWRQIDPGFSPWTIGDIDPDFPLGRQTLPGDGLHVPAGHLNTDIALLSGIEGRHVIALNRVQYSVDGHRILVRPRSTQSQRSEAGRRAVVPGTDIAEDRGDPYWKGGDRLGGGKITGRAVDQRAIAENELGWLIEQLVSRKILGSPRFRD